jgi:hypothetical protein
MYVMTVQLYSSQCLRLTVRPTQQLSLPLCRYDMTDTARIVIYYRQIINIYNAGV